MRLFLALALAISAAPAHAQSVADFYRGKSIRLIIGDRKSTRLNSSH